MLPPRRVIATLSIWFSGMAICPAQEAGSAARSAFSTLFDGAPLAWVLIFIAAIATIALLIQSVFVLQNGRISPTAFIEAFKHATQSGNYQEAWETCQRWRQSALARMLQPALERIGQGREPVEARLAEQCRTERRRILAQLWCMLGGAIAVAVFCVIAMMVEMHAVDSAAMSARAPRALALAVGDMAVLAALAAAALIPASVLWFLLRARAELRLQAAGEQGQQLIAALPYEEIEGVRIGQDFNAGTMLGDAGDAPAGRLQVSTELTTLCPSCNGPINSSRNFCPHCGQLFTWS
jgi:biopolymer transport protein ExbB